MPANPLQEALDFPLLPLSATGPRPSRLEEEVIRLFDELRVPLLRYLTSLGLPVADAEEIAQDVFLNLYRHLKQGKSRVNLRAWTFTVAHHLGLKSRLRSQRVSSCLPEDSADLAPGPEELLAEQQRRERLQAVVRALPELDRCCLALRAEGLRYREIARVLGISLGSVSHSLERSLARLRRSDAAYD